MQKHSITLDCPIELDSNYSALYCRKGYLGLFIFLTCICQQFENIKRIESIFVSTENLINCTSLSSVVLLWRYIHFHGTTNVLCQAGFPISAGMLGWRAVAWLQFLYVDSYQRQSSWINFIFPPSLVLWSCKSIFQTEATNNYCRSQKKPHPKHYSN